MDSRSKFEETKLCIMLYKNGFYSKLNMKCISDQDYEDAQQAWKRITPEFEIVSAGRCI